METQQTIDYNRIAEAIEFLKSNFKSQPSLEQAAEHVHLSQFHFQRLFQNWAGVTPKQFLQYLSVEHARYILRNTQATLSEAAEETGLSGTGRLHDLFVKMEGMTPGEFKNGGASLRINYSFAETPFGDILIASTQKGICYMAFVTESQTNALQTLQNQFPSAHYTQLVDGIQQNGLFIFNQDWSKLSQIKLHLKGTPFQLRVWETLLRVPVGGLTSYASLAQQAGYAGASRAVGTAVGSNPVAFLIPCHRVIKSTGETGQYHWGTTRKSAIIGWESGRAQSDV
jgi:AraC family transcriptional regulator of adaptative response/methylated-DNA-[protein]-cysteine methyltransferase